MTTLAHSCADSLCKYGFPISLYEASTISEPTISRCHRHHTDCVTKVREELTVRPAFRCTVSELEFLMSPEDKSSETNAVQNPQAAEAVADAHRRLTALRKELNKHPDLEAAIERLEAALSILTTKTGGML